MYISVRKTEGAIKNGRHWQYWAQKKQKVQSRMVDTGNIGHKKTGQRHTKQTKNTATQN